LLLAIRFCPQLGVAKGIYYAVFHSISAFCNAGFDLMGRFSPYSSLALYQDDILVNVTIMTLIIAGGLGFVVWSDMIEHKWQYTRYKLHTKLVLLSTIFLILIGAGLFYIMEKDNTFSGLSPIGKLMAAFFQSVTPRTAGFNTVDTASLTQGSTILTMLFMLVGASPGSTGGGMKTTTIVVILLSTLSYIRNEEDINIFKRRLEKNILKRAYCNVTLYFVLIILSLFFIMAVQELPLKDITFEVLSAIGTVGMSTGVTRELNNVSRLIILLLMYSGRIGSLTLAMAIMSRISKKPAFRNAEEKIIIG